MEPFVGFVMSLLVRRAEMRCVAETEYGICGEPAEWMVGGCSYCGDHVMAVKRPLTRAREDSPG